jgi:FMNH2-dependent dimethyl sulfone monooxygenase
MKQRRVDAGLPPFEAFGMAAYVIVRETEEEAQAELARITDVQHGRAYESYQDFISKSQLEHVPSLEDYSVSNRGLRPGFVGTPAQVAERIKEFEDAGVDTLLLQFSPQLEEMDRFGEQVIPLVRSTVGVQS